MSDEKPGDSDTPSADAPKEADKKGLNDLLASWDDKSSDEPKPKKDDGALATEVALLSYEREMDKLIPRVKGDLKVSDKFVEAFMNMKANDDPRLRELWDNRRERRAEYDQAMDAVAEELKAEVGTPEPKPADDPDKGLAAAIHTAREVDAGGGGLDDVDFGALSDSDLALKKAEIFRLAKSGNLK